MNIFKNLLLISVSVCMVFGQQNIPDDPAGSFDNLKTGKLDGNRIITVFENNTAINKVENRGAGVAVWPSEINAKEIASETKFLVGSKVYLDSDGNPIEAIENVGDAAEILYFLESDGNDEIGGFAPVSGYFVDGAERPAISNDPNTWPMTWPDVSWTNSEKNWNGRRGKNYHNSDLETYFVTNDATNKEHIEKYKPGGDDNWGGLGLRCATRSFQWRQYPMDNTIIWEYKISNISNYTLPEIFIGLYRDNSIGGNEYYSGEMVYTDKDIKTVFEWDANFIPVERPDHPGLVAIVVTTTPDNDADGIDNDGDGLIDESRVNEYGYVATEFEGVANVPAFLDYFGFDTSYAERSFFFGDEDRDWKDGEDLDENSVYDYGRDRPGDDVGTDGIGPYDIGYEGPDPDGTECNHLPDQGEPNFGLVDNDEGDQVKIKTYSVMDKRTFNSQYGLDRIEKTVDFINNGEHKTQSNTSSDNILLIGTDSFSFHTEKSTSFSFAEIHSADPLAGLRSYDENFNAPDLFDRKIILNKVVMEDFQFMKKPIMPKVTASAGDSKVTLVWDDIARQFATQPFLDNENNFEGYKVYRATDAQLKDAMTVTDGYGVPFKYKPIAQYDLVNGKSQYINYGAERGSGFFLGNDIGIKNFFIDNSVRNGIKYHYVVTAYNSGTYKVGDGVAPLESDFDLNPNNLSSNVVAVTPRITSAGFEGAGVYITERNTLGTGMVQPSIFVDSNIKPGHEYKMVFESEAGPAGGSSYYVPAASIYRTDGFKIYDITDVTDDTSTGTLVYYENNKKYNGKNFYFDLYDDSQWNHDPDGWVIMDTNEVLETASFDGLKVNFMVKHPTARPDWEKIKWEVGDAPVNLQIPSTKYKMYMAFDYDIVFTDNDSAYQTVSNPTIVYDFDKNRINDVLFDQSYNFYVLNWSVLDSLGNPDTADVVTWDINSNGTYDPLEDAILIGHSVYSVRGGWKFNSTLLAAIIDFGQAGTEEDLPQPGDIFNIRWIRPFFNGDYVKFKVNGYTTENPEKIKSNMDKIKVVPNPYIFTNIAEPAGDVGNWERRMMFTHLPERCTIKIYTITGLLVDEIAADNTTKEDMFAGSVKDVGNGIAFWDLTNSKGKPVAPGYYIYRVKSEVTGETFMDKFAIIK